MAIISGLFKCFSLSLIPAVLWFQVGCENVDMRIVDEPTVYSWQQNNVVDQTRVLHMRVDPAPFAGPVHLQQLNGKCFSRTITKYEYKFCPFSNVTQKDVETIWNGYHGVLGVWQEWNIEGNQFVSMMMYEGDTCGNKARQTEVKLICGNESVIERVSEPKHCEYELIFLTPLVCHNHSMLVYPTLSEELRYKWNQLLTDYKSEELTEKGYKKGLSEIFISAGLLKAENPNGQEKAIPDEDKNNVKKQPVEENPSSFPYNHLATCNQEYEKLAKELENIKQELYNLKEIVSQPPHDKEKIPEQ